MKKWIKKVTPTTKSLRNMVKLKKLKPYFTSHYYWARDHQAIARGVAAGLAGAVIPGFQIIYAAILVTLLRGNLPVALICTLITNPLTFTPISYFIYYIGSVIIRNGSNEFVLKRFEWDFSSFHAFWFNVSGWTMQFGKAYLVGLPVVSICLGLIGYFGTLLIWEVSAKLISKKKK